MDQIFIKEQSFYTIKKRSFLSPFEEAGGSVKSMWAASCTAQTSTCQRAHELISVVRRGFLLSHHFLGRSSTALANVHIRLLSHFFKFRPEFMTPGPRGLDLYHSLVIDHTHNSGGPCRSRSPSATTIKERSNALLKGRGRRSPPGLRPYATVMATADVV